MTDNNTSLTGQITAEQDALIGQDVFLALHRLVRRLAKRHRMDPDRVADYLLAGSLMTAADIYKLSIDDTVEVMTDIADSIQNDSLPKATRH